MILDSGLLFFGPPCIFHTISFVCVMYNTYNTSKYTIMYAVGLGLWLCVPQLLPCFYEFRFHQSCCMKSQLWRIFIAFLFLFLGFSPCFPLPNSEFMTLILWYSKSTHVTTVRRRYPALRRRRHAGHIDFCESHDWMLERRATMVSRKRPAVER